MSLKNRQTSQSASKSSTLSPTVSPLPNPSTQNNKSQQANIFSSTLIQRNVEIKNQSFDINRFTFFIMILVIILFALNIFLIIKLCTLQSQINTYNSILQAPINAEDVLQKHFTSV